jgi:hypothetical protein
MQRDKVFWWVANNSMKRTALRAAAELGCYVHMKREVPFAGKRDAHSEE